MWDGLGGARPGSSCRTGSSPGHPETELIDDVVARYDADGTPHWKLRDGQVLVVDGDSATVV